MHPCCRAASWGAWTTGTEVGPVPAQPPHEAPSRAVPDLTATADGRARRENGPGCIWPPQSGHGGQGKTCLAHGGGQRGVNPISEGLEMLAMGMPLWGPRLLLGRAKANLHLLEPS